VGVVGKESPRLRRRLAGDMRGSKLFRSRIGDPGPIRSCKTSRLTLTDLARDVFARTGCDTDAFPLVSSTAASANILVSSCASSEAEAWYSTDGNARIHGFLHILCNRDFMEKCTFFLNPLGSTNCHATLPHRITYFRFQVYHRWLL
jgi:hypothetical protein